MEIRKNVDGTALIVVLIIITIVTVVVTTALRRATLLYELAIDRVEQTSQICAAQALAQYGIACCKNIKMVQGKPDQNSYHYAFDHWPLPAGDCQGTITITPKEAEYFIEAILKKGNEQRYAIHTKIAHQEEAWRIVSWNST